MNDGVFVTRKTFGSVEDTLSAFYQLWMLPDMQDRANFVGYTEFDIEFEDHVYTKRRRSSLWPSFTSNSRCTKNPSILLIPKNNAEVCT